LTNASSQSSKSLRRTRFIFEWMAKTGKGLVNVPEGDGA
jgi:hypothetical protein